MIPGSDQRPSEVLGSASAWRLALARRLSEACPPSLASEIAVTGSVSRGLADRFSDTEIICWVDALPNLDTARAWLERSGVVVSKVFADEEETWIVGRYEGTWLEVGWSLFSAIETVITGLLGGERSGHGSLQIASMLCHAIPLRTGGRLSAWQRRLSVYPADLQARVIRANTEAWEDPHLPGVRWALAARRALMPLALRFTWDMQNVWALLYAINRVWEPDYKWVTDEALALPLKPSHLASRINSIFTLSDPAQSVHDDFRLILDILDLVPAHYDVAAARDSIAGGLKEYRSDL